MSSELQRSVILIVDDVVENLDILGRILSSEYRVKIARNGREALAVTQSEGPPDLILLDIMMPDIDGYEVCRRLKKDAITRDIPVIFLTALSDAADEAQGLELGAIDYITKPFNPELVKHRVRNHLALRAIQHELQRNNERLEELVQERTQALAAALRRLKIFDETKREFLCAIAHELRTPANGVIGIGELALNSLSDMKLQEKLRGYFDQSCSRLQETLSNALRLAQLQTGDAPLRSEPISLEKILPPRDKISSSPSNLEGMMIWGNEALLREAFTTLLQMMTKLTHASEQITVTARETADSCDIVLSGCSGKLPADAYATFFETFSYGRTSSLAEELGLAVPVAGKIIMAMGGKIRLEPALPTGIQVCCSLPIPPKHGCSPAGH